MVGKYKVITLCGSTQFKDEFMEAQKRLTLEGNIVISVGLFGHSGDDEVWTEGTKEMLDDMHKRKIDMADEIFVINVDGYIGSSTRSEIEYALTAGKPVRYLENEMECYIPVIVIDDAIKTLKKRRNDMAAYTEIMKMSSDPSDPEFQRKYGGFYRLRRNEAWRKEYFKLMKHYRKRDNATFGEILLRMYKATKQVEPSFSSKMLATLNQEMPIWDSNVLAALNLHPTGQKPAMKITLSVALYDCICRWYAAFLETETANDWITKFDKAFPEFTGFSEVKKVDFLLWAGMQNSKKEEKTK